MKYFFLNTLGDLHDRELCVLDQAPEGLGVKYSRLVRGRSIEADFPSDAVVRMSPDRPGIRLGSLLGNTKRFLIVHGDVKQAIAAAHAERGSGWPIEYLPFTLLNHKQRVHSSDYFFVNPLGAIDCVDQQRSVINCFEGDATKVLSISRLVLDPAKLVDAPPLFRIPPALDQYVVDEALRHTFEERGFSNLLFDEIELQPES